MEQNSSLIYLIKLMIKWKKQLIVISIIASIAGVATAFILPVYYKSVCLFYPYSPKAYDPRFLFSSGTDIDLFGTGDDADRVISIGNSSDISNYIINKYNLIDRYDINRNDPYQWIDVTKNFQQNYKIAEDDRSAIVVTVFDKNADTAALMANDIVEQIDYFNRKPLMESSKKQLDKYKKDLEVKYNTIDSLNKKEKTSTKKLTQSEDDMISMEMISTYSDLKEAETRLSILEDNFKTLHIIEKASPVIKKAKPVRWLVAGGIALGSVLLSIIFIVLMDQYNKNLRGNLN